MGTPRSLNVGPRIPPAAVLFVLSPMIAELLSGSSPPVEFFNPLVFLVLLKDLGSRGLGDMHQFALAAGALGFLILLAPIQELDKNRTDNPAGMGLVGLSFLLFLIVLGYRIRRRVMHLDAIPFQNGS